MNTPLQSFLAQQSDGPVHGAIKELAKSLRNHHGRVLAVLAYGSALRDSEPENTLIDYYVLTSDFQDVSSSWLARSFCRRIPPNVYFHEQRVGPKIYRCKYAVMPMSLLARKCAPTRSNPYFWIRFAQPMRIVWTADSSAHQEVVSILAQAAETSYAHARQLTPRAPALVQWITLLEHTYRTELRPEQASRAAAIVDSQAEYFATISTLVSPVMPSAKPWATRQWQGKVLSLARLLKAAFTFQGGADYAAWKIKRHSGIDIEITDWHRRHPVLASIVLLPKVLRKGALK